MTCLTTLYLSHIAMAYIYCTYWPVGLTQLVYGYWLMVVAWLVGYTLYILHYTLYILQTEPRWVQEFLLKIVSDRSDISQSSLCWIVEKFYRDNIWL